jgi:hypothetical protein
MFFLPGFGHWENILWQLTQRHNDFNCKSIEGKWISTQKTIQLTISDSISGIKSYDGYLNGSWILFEYDNKTRK